MSANPAFDAFQMLVRDAVKAVLQEAVPTLLAQIRPVVSAEFPPMPTGSQQPDYVPVKEAARLMSAHPSTIRKLVASGHIGRYHLAGQLRVKLSDIHAYMARQSGERTPTIDLDERAVALLARGRR